jgi:tetratricopeptide (TPR) repeat protein
MSILLPACYVDDGALGNLIHPSYRNSSLRGYPFAKPHEEETMKRTVLLIVVGFFTLMGCAPGGDYYQQANQYKGQKNLEKAIEYYEKAVKEEPDNAQYSKALKATRDDLATIKYNELIAQYNRTSTFNIKILAEFIRKVEKIRAISADVAVINKFAQTVSSKHDAMKSEAFQTYEKALDNLGKKRYFEAVMDFKRVVALDPENQDANLKLDHYSEQVLNALYKDAKEQMNAQRWKEAVEALEKAYQIDPGYKDVRASLKMSRQNNNAQFFVNKGETAIKNERWEEAITYYGRALEYEPENKNLNDRMDFIKTKYALFKGKRAEKAFLRGKIGESALEFRYVIRFNPRLKNSLFARTLLKKVYQLGKNYEANGKWGNAYVWYSLLHDMDPEYQDLFFRLQKIEDELNKRIIIQMAVLDFESRRDNPDAGARVSNSLISYLFQHNQADMRIVERDALQSILKEFQLEQAGIVDLRAAKKIGKISGIKILVIGNVLVADVKEQKFPERKRKKVVIGYETVANPAYNAFIMANASRMDDPDIRRLAPPPTIQKENNQILDYEEGTVTRTGYLDVAVRIIDMENGEIISTRTVKAKAPFTDRYSEGLELANVKRDPLKLPDETEVFKKTLDKAVAEVGTFILTPFLNLEKKYFQKANYYSKRRDYTESIEFLVDTIMDVRIKKSGEATAAKAKKDIEKILMTRVYK